MLLAMKQGLREPASEASVPRGAALAFALALGATGFMAAPVLDAPSQRLFGSASLGRENPNRDALIVIEQMTSGRVRTPYLQPLTDLPGRALARLVSPVAAYNLLTLATFPSRLSLPTCWRATSSAHTWGRWWRPWPMRSSPST